MLLPSKYFEIVRREGHRLTEMDSNEFAFPRAAALAAIDALKGSPVAILGGDALRISGGKALHTYDNWYCDRAPTEDPLHYVDRTHDEAKRYIEGYSESGDILYLLVLSELGVTPIFVGDLIK
jgi:hypothetical protein